MNLDKLTIEELKKMLDQLQIETSTRIDDAFNKFVDDISNMGLIKSYLSSKEQKFLSEMKRLSNAISNHVDSLVDDIHVINTTSSNISWKIGEKIAEKEIKSIIPEGLFEKLRANGIFEHRKKSLDSFTMSKKDFRISSRVWKEGIKGQIEDSLQLAFVDGKSANELSRDIRKCLQEPDRLYRRVRDAETGELKLSKAAKEYHPGQGVYRSSYKNAMRLCRNEINKSYRRAEWESYQDNPAIVGFRIRLSNNHTLNGKPFVDICDYAQGVYPKDFKWHGWHVQCRCVMEPVFASRIDLEKMEDAILAGGNAEDIQVKQVSSIPKKFIDWSQKHKKQISGWDSKPDYILDNKAYAEKYFTYKDVFKTDS